MSVARCQQEVSRFELYEWMALYEQEPWGVGREEMRAATLATLLGNIMGVIVRLGGGQGSRPYRIDDFLPRAPARQQTPEQSQALFSHFLRQSGAVN